MSIIQEHKDFIIFLGKKFGKKSFSIEEAKKYITIEEHFTEKDFSTWWQQSFNPSSEDTYIKRDGENFILTYKALKLLPKKEKTPWTHNEIIALVSVSVTSATSLIVSILNLIF